MYELIAIVFIRSSHSYEMDIKQKFIYFVFVWSKILCGNEYKIDNIHCKIMYVLIAIVFVTSYHSYEMDLKQKFIHYVFVLSKILCGSE